MSKDKPVDARTKELRRLIEAAGRSPGRYRRERSLQEEAYVGYVRGHLPEVCAASGLSWDRIAEELTRLGLPTEGRTLQKRLTEGTISYAHALMLMAALRLENVPVPTLAEAKKVHEKHPRQFKKRNRLAID